MKKLNNKIFMITLVSVILFGGCEKTNNSENISGDINDTPLIETENSTGNINDSALLFSDMQGQRKTDVSSDKNISNSITINEENENRKYIKSNANFYENCLLLGNDTTFMLDLDTLEKIPFCNKPNCIHNNSSCFARLASDDPIIYKDNIYYFNSTSEFQEDKDGSKFVISSKLMKASMTSFETETVCEFTDCMPNIPSYYVLDGSILYFTGNDMNPDKDEYGGISTSNVGGYHFLCSIDLDSGEYKNHGSIYDGDKEYEMAGNSSGANITGIYQNKMYIQYVYMKEHPEKSGVPAEECWTRVNLEYDFNTKELKESKLPAALYVDNNTYAYYEHEKKETIIIDNGVTYHVPYYDITTMSLNIINDKAFFYDEWYDLSDMSKHSYGEYDGYEVISYYNDSYVLLKGSKTVRLTESELLNIN